MSQLDLAQGFEAHRPHLRGVAYRMLGSLSDADDAVQEAWLRLHRADNEHVTNLVGWLTTVVARVALDMLRARKSRREDPLEVGLPDPVVAGVNTMVGADPEQSAVVADSVSLALLVVLETLSPSERLVFVLHDLFAVPFDEIGSIVDRSPAAAKQLASRARSRVRGQVPAVPPADPGQHRQVVAAFLAATREGDLDGLLAVLDPAVTLRVDRAVTSEGEPRVVVFEGARTVAAQALTFARFAQFTRPATVNGAPGLIAVVNGELISVQGITVHHGLITEIDLHADRARLRAFGAGSSSPGWRSSREPHIAGYRRPRRDEQPKGSIS